VNSPNSFNDVFVRKLCFHLAITWQNSWLKTEVRKQSRSKTIRPSVHRSNDRWVSRSVGERVL